MTWHLKGEFLENCNCEVLCPCIVSGDEGPGTYERCLVPTVCRIDDGELDGLRLDGLCFVHVVDAPAVMALPDWRAAFYFDERATPEQREALRAILVGELGGPPAAMAALTTEVVGFRDVPIHFEVDGRRRRASVPDLLDIEIEGLSVPGADELYEIVNVRHPFGDSLPLARAERGRMHDPELGFVWDNTGRNAHFRRFSWSA